LYVCINCITMIHVGHFVEYFDDTQIVEHICSTFEMS